MHKHSEEMIDLEGLVRGDAKAFERIYGRYRDRVYGFAYRMLNSQPLAEEVTHEAFLVLIEHPQRYDADRASVLTFLCAIARNQIMHQFRHSGYEAEVILDGGDVDLVGGENVLEGDPLTNLLDEELAAEINRVVDTLPVLLREAIVLREYQGLSYEEIADVAGVSVNTVKVRLHRARRALARALTPYMNIRNGGCCHELC